MTRQLPPESVIRTSRIFPLSQFFSRFGRQFTPLLSFSKFKLLAAILTFSIAVVMAATVPAGADFNIKLLDDTSTGATVRALNNIGDVLFVRHNWNTNRDEIYIQYGNQGAMINIINDFYNNLPGFSIFSDNGYGISLNDRGQAAWIHCYWDGAKYHYYISYYNKGTVNIIVNNTLNELHGIKINNNGQIMWADATARSIYLYENGTISKITESWDLTWNSDGGPNLTMNNTGQIVWVQGNNIFIYDKANGVRNISTNKPGVYNIYINDSGRVAWNSNTDPYWATGNIYICDINNSLIPAQITNSGTATYLNLNNKGQIVWFDSSGLNLYTNGQIQNISASNSMSWFGPRINNIGEVIWTSGGPEVYYWNNGKINQIPRVTVDNYFGNVGGAINDLSQIWFWQEISWGWGCDLISYLATPQVEVAESKQIYALCIGTRTNQGEGKDFRGDLAAIDMGNIFKKYIKNDDHVMVLSKDVTEGIKKSDVQAKINDLNNRMKAGDLLLIYITGHGSNAKSENGGDAYVIIGPDQSSLSSEGILSDTDLYNYLNIKGMEEKTKWVMIDACHSGGFWGKNCDKDDGGLERLKKIGFLAATWSVSSNWWDITAFIAGGAPYYNYGVVTIALEDAFALTPKGTPKASGDDGILTIEKLYSYVHLWGGWLKWPEDWKVTYGEMAFGDPIIMTQDKWNPGCGKTDDVKAIKVHNRPPITSIIDLLLTN